MVIESAHAPPVENIWVVLLALLACLAAGWAAAQPAPAPRPPAVEKRLAGKESARSAEKRKADIAGRIERGTVDRSGSSASTPIGRVLDQRLSSAALRTGLDAFRLRQIRQRKRDPRFLGVIDSVRVGGIEVTLERRRVQTDRGALTLLLNRVGNEYVFDGDLVVPRNAIEGAGSAAFSAGFPGTFGKGTLWDDAIIPFEVEPAFCCTAALVNAIAFYEANTIFRLVPRDGHQTYVRFINAEPFTASRTSLGKHQGENTIRIQGTATSGQPNDPVDVNGSIQHEIGHVLGLIHEHLRSDRDQFIARNPACTPTDIFQGIYQGWIDVGQSTFTEDAAELLTPYDFESRMHYSFGLDTDGDGIADCSTWVRIDTCPGGDPASPACVANFSSFALTASDIEGLHTLYVRVPNDPQVRTFTGDNVRHRGRRIDRCLHGLPLFQDGCSVESRGRVADEFCRAKGFEQGSDVLTESLSGEHSGFDTTVGWKNVWGTDVISSLVCQGLTEDAERMRADELIAATASGSEVKIGGRPIDRCVHGDGITGDRCGIDNQQRVADRFCELRRFDRSSGFKTDFSVEANAIGFHPATNEFRNVSALDVFTEIDCVSADTTALGTFETFAGDNVRHRDRRIDRCLHGAAFGEDGCAAAARSRVANEFCRTKGFQEASVVQYQGMVGEHSGFDRIVGWKNVWGADVISSVRCSNLTRDEERVQTQELEAVDFSGDGIKVSARFVDRCVHGDGISGDRCSRGNQRRIADRFCELQQFDHASVFQTEPRVELNAIGFHPSTNDFRNVSSADVFTAITCVRPSGNP